MNQNISQACLDQKLRRIAKRKGVGVSKRFNEVLGCAGYILYDLRGNYVLAGCGSVPYSLTYDEAAAFLQLYDPEEVS